MTTTGTAAITGASGFIGRVLVERLRAERPVRVLVRRRDELADRWERGGVEIVVGDLEDDAALARLVRGSDAVFHCAAFMGKSDPRRSHDVNVTGTASVARAALVADVRRFVYVSSISVFGATRAPDGVITERARPRRVHRLNAYARTKFLGERVVRRLGATDGLAYTIVRPTNVYGPGSGPWFRQLAAMLARVPIAFGDLPVDVVYVDDVADAMVLAAGSPGAVGEVFHVGHEMVPMNRFMVEVAAVMGRRARLLPRGVDRVVRTLVDRGYRVATGTCMSLSLRAPVRYPHDRASAVLGYAPGIDLAEGFARLRAWYAAGADAGVAALLPTRSAVGQVGGA